YAPPDWLATVRTGLITVVYTSIGLAVAMLLAMVVLFVIAFQSAQTAAARGSRGPAANVQVSEDVRQWTVVVMVVALIGGLVIALGTWMMSTPDPTGAGGPSVKSVRSFLRATIVVSMIAAVGYAAFAVVTGPAEAQHGTAGIVLGALSYLVQGAMSVAEGIYLAHLASRVPAPALQGRLKLSGGVVGVCMAIMGLLGAASQAMFGADLEGGRTPNMASAGPLVAVGCISGLAGLTVLAFVIVLVVGMGQLAGHFREARRYALNVYGQPAGGGTGGGGAGGAGTAVGGGPFPPGGGLPAGGFPAGGYPAGGYPAGGYPPAGLSPTSPPQQPPVYGNPPQA
ncbi:MAG TPA: hypothetical protein VF796_19370, partial [Humisphaera sp.]